MNDAISLVQLAIHFPGKDTYHKFSVQRWKSAIHFLAQRDLVRVVPYKGTFLRRRWTLRELLYILQHAQRFMNNDVEVLAQTLLEICQQNPRDTPVITLAAWAVVDAALDGWRNWKWVQHVDRIQHSLVNALIATAKSRGTCSRICELARQGARDVRAILGQVEALRIQ